VPSTVLDEQRVAAYVRGELSQSERKAVEAALDEQPEWLAVVALLARQGSARGAEEEHDDAGQPTGGVPAPGTRVGRYELGPPLGRGASGVVCEAWDPELRRDVAIKLVDPSLLSHPKRAQARLSREAKALARVHDPHVVRVFDVGTWRGRVFIAMERLDGGTLDDWRRAQPRSWKQVVSRWVAAGRGLLAAHQHDLVHRDFKPSNVMLDSEERVVVVDFGLAAQAGSSTDGVGEAHEASEDSSFGEALTKTGASVGTPAYMAPEQRSTGDGITPAADQYAFCVSLHEALAGRLPDGVVRAKLPPLVDTPPASVWRAIERGRHQDPARRHDSLAPLLGELEAALSGRARQRMLVAGAVAGIAALAWIGSSSSPAPCGTTDPIPSRAEVVGQLAARSESFAEDTSKLVGARLDAWSGAWMSARDSACEARQAGTLDDGGLDRVHLCLDRDQRRAATFVDSLRDPDAVALRGAVDLVQLLPPPGDCLDDPEAIGKPSQREIVLAIGAGLDELETSRLVGRGEGGVAAAERLVEQADESGIAYLRAITRLELGTMLERTTDLERASKVYREGSQIAETEALPDLAARLFIHTAWIEGYRFGKVEEGEQLVEHAKAWALRSQHDAAIESNRLRTLGMILMSAGRLKEAEAAMSEAAQWLDRIAEGDHERLEMLISVDNDYGALLVSSGRLDEGGERLARAAKRQIDRVGEGHPAVAEIQNNVAAILRARGKYHQAREIFQRNVQIMTDAYGPDHPELGMTKVNLAIVALDLGEGETALADASSAIEILGKGGQAGLGLVMAAAWTTRGEARSMTGDPEAALGDFRHARSLLVEAYGEQHSEVAVVDSNVGAALLELGRPKAALEAYESAMRIASEAWGEDDARLASVWVGIGDARTDLNESAEATKAYQRAVTMAGEREEGRARTKLGGAKLAAGDLEHARKQLELALERFEKTPGDPTLAAAAWFALARTLHASALEPERARALATRARTVWEEDENVERVAEVDAFLDALGGSGDP